METRICLAVKHPGSARGTYRRIREFVTFHGIFMVPGYGPGERKGLEKIGVSFSCTFVEFTFLRCILRY